MIKVFQPVLVRHGYTTRTGLAAHAARASWLSSQTWPDGWREEWLSRGGFAQVRSAHLPDFNRLSQSPQWSGDSTSIAGPLSNHDTADPVFLKAKHRGWSPWGTVEPPEASVLVVINSRLGLDHPEFIALACTVLNHESAYRGQPISVVEQPLSMLGEVLWR